jgi:Zn finger protein HypA/HybF involved in hydrogenase expression
MCVTPVVKCWHCGEWFVKKANRGEFEDCPHCGKGFEDLTPEAQVAVKATIAPFFEVPKVREIA